jgi:hypothetical protein
MDGNALLPPPILKLPSQEQETKLNDLNSKVEELTKFISDQAASLQYVDPATVTNAAKTEPEDKIWFEDEFPPKAQVASEGGSGAPAWTESSGGPVHSGKKSLKRKGKGLHQANFANCDAPLLIKTGDKFFAYVYLDPEDPPKALMLQFYTDDWKYRVNWGNAACIKFGEKSRERVQGGDLPELGKWVRLSVDAESMGLKPGSVVSGISLTQFDGTAYWDQVGIVTVDDPSQDFGLSFATWEKIERERGDRSLAPDDAKELLKKETGKLDNAERGKLKAHFLGYVYTQPGESSGLVKARAELKSTREERDAFEKDVPATMVSNESEKPRPTYVLIRGEYDKHGEQVGPGVPSVLPPLSEAETTNRLVFANWLVSTNHPLTARVTVNRFWQQFFGTGLVKTSEDFGAKGEWPSHPELLDWLATEFMRQDWDVKQLVRLIVTSATYRQDSKVTPELLAVDPENRLLARGPRFRLDAEVLRDNALFVSGLLNLKAGGRGVRTYQPPGIWEAVGYTTSNTAKYSQDEGEALFRRSLYIFWKRTAPPPSMTTFDAPSREKCTARRERTNTPLQALVTLNDPQYFEAARHFGYRMIREGGATEADRLRYGFRAATARWPSPEETATLEEVFSAYRGSYQGRAEDAKKLIEVGDTPVPHDVPAPELAAYTLVANLILNLDEVITRN